MICIGLMITLEVEVMIMFHETTPTNFLTGRSDKLKEKIVWWRRAQIIGQSLKMVGLRLETLLWVKVSD